MPSTTLDPRAHGPHRAVHGPSPRTIVLGLALSMALAACAKTGSRPVAPLEALHYPAWVGYSSALPDQLLVANLDEDLEFDNGSLMSLDVSGTAAPILPAPGAGLAVPYMAGKLLVVDPALAAAQGCVAGVNADFAPPFVLLAGHSDDVLLKVPLATPLADQPVERIGLGASAASSPFGVGLSCGLDGKARAWVSYQRGRDGIGYVAQVDLSKSPPVNVAVNLGPGYPRSFAYDREHDRLYVTTQESQGHAPIRWITVGNGCLDLEDGIQDERKGGCHVDAGFDLSATLAGAEPNEMALSTGPVPCVSGPYVGLPQCRRMYLTVRMYDADLERAMGERPSKDIGGKLVVLELSESGKGGPDARWIRGIDVGVTASELLVIPRDGKRDLVVMTSLDDDLLWIYDDEVGAMAKVFARNPYTGVPPLGHYPSGITGRDMGGGVWRVYVASYHDHWVSAVDIRLDDPASASIVNAAGTSLPLRMGNKP